MAQHTSAVRSVMLAAALAACVTAAFAANPQASKLYEDALLRFEGKDYPGAIIQLKNAVAIDAGNISVQVLLGKALVANGEVAAAEVALGEALRLGVNRSETVLPLARALIAQGKQQSLVNDPRLSPAGLPSAVQAKIMLLRAGAMADLGDYRGAIKGIEEARALEPNSAESWMAEVPVRLRSKQQAEATTAATKAVTLAPGSAEALYLRGQAAHVFGDRIGAGTWYDRALQASPTHVEALVSRAGLLMDAGKLAEAERDVAALTSAAQTEPRGWYLKSLLAERQGKPEETSKALNDVTALLDPVPMEYLRYRPQVLMLGGLAHYGLRQFEKARPYLEAVQRAQPNSPVNKLLAEIHIRDKNLDRALAALDAYTRAFPNDAQGLALLASARTRQGRC